MKIISNLSKFSLFCFFIFSSFKVFAQPINDDCANAIFLPNISNYCSGIAAFSNSLSTASGFGLPTCWTATATEDIWFTFTAIGTDALISASGSGNGGTMVRPRISIYFGSCAGTINQLACANGTAGSGTTQLYQGALSPGTVYLIRISTIAANEGSFELCVNNYTPSSNPGADCGGAAFLCNNDPVSVASLTGGGLNNDEPESSSCMEDPFGPDEGNSSWYYFQAGTSGLFAFDIIPVNPTDDIDFLLYQLSGPNPCGPRTFIRCNTSSCLNINGSTGLNYTDTDVTENPNCDPGENAYCAPLNMTAGTYYALLVNNFSTSSGYTINFNTIPNGGSIGGPRPVLTANPLTICAGNTVTFSGASSTNVGGGLTWNFVNGGNPTAASGAGPHQITYNSPGNYTAILTGTDITGCRAIESVIIRVTSSPIVNLVSLNNVDCYSNATGSININTSGGTAAYTYNWGSGINTEDRFGLTAGVYTVTVTDINACSTTNSFTITEPSTPLSSNTNATTLACFGDSNASIDLTAIGGTPAYSYNWGSGVVSEDRNNLTAGAYAVTVTDANGCTSSNSVIITEPTAMTTTFTSNTILCFGDSTGTIDITTNGGTGTYNFNWGSGIISEDRTNLVAGVYTVTVTDQNLCSTTNTISITEPAAALNSNTIQLTNGTCTQGGSVDINVSGGTSPYTYLWSNGETTQDISSLATGTYDLTITDANGCVFENTGNNIITLGVPSLNLDTTTNLNCFASNNGSIQITVNGGSPAYNYLWSNGSTSEDLTGLSSGSYEVTVTDNLGCTVQITGIVITEPTAVSISNIQVQAASCGNANGSINLDVNGGTPGYNYIWNNGNSSQDLSNLAAGSYAITVFDANNCIVSSNNIIVNGGPAISVNLSFTNPLCNQPNTGNVTATISGGTAPFTFIWSNGESNQNLTNVSAGSYFLTITDFDSCTDTANVTLISPLQPTINAFISPSNAVDSILNWGDNTNLFAGTVDQSSLGVVYSWNYFGPSTPNFTSNNNFSTTINPSAVGAYEIYLSATSLDGCISLDTISVLVEFDEPQIPTAFSPNNDGNNETFYVINLDKSLVEEFKVYNRWGQLVYDNKEEAEWNGIYNNVLQPRDVYMYVISWIDPNQPEGKNIKRGQLTLLR